MALSLLQWEAAVVICDTLTRFQFLPRSPWNRNCLSPSIRYRSVLPRKSEHRKNLTATGAQGSLTDMSWKSAFTGERSSKVVLFYRSSSDIASRFKLDYFARKGSPAESDVLSSEELHRILRNLRQDKVRTYSSTQDNSDCVSGAYDSVSLEQDISQHRGRHTRLLKENLEDSSSGVVISTASPPPPASASCSRICEETSSCSTSVASSHPTSDAIHVTRHFRWSVDDIAQHDSLGVSCSKASSAASSPCLALRARPTFRSPSLRYTCLSGSLLYHLRLLNPGCCSLLHLYATAGLPLEPLMPELPHLVLRLLQVGALQNTKEVAFCLRACAILLGRAHHCRTERSDDACRTRDTLTCLAEDACDNTPPAKQGGAVPLAKEAREAWLAVCLAFEAEFSRRLQYQFDHMRESLRNLEALHCPHSRSGSCQSRIPVSGQPKIEGSKKRDGPPFLSSLPHHQGWHVNERGKICEHVSSRGSLARRRREHCCLLGVVNPGPPMHRKKESQLLINDFSPALSDRSLSACGPRNSGTATYYCDTSSIEVENTQSLYESRSLASSFPRTVAVRTSSAFDNDIFCYTHEKHVNSFSRRVTPTGHQTEPYSCAQGNARETQISDSQIPYPYLVTPPDLSMFMSSYAALVKHSLPNHRVAGGLLAAGACYLYVYLCHCSPHAFTLAASVIAKMAEASAACVSSFSQPLIDGHKTCMLVSSYIGPFTKGYAARKVAVSTDKGPPPVVECYQGGRSDTVWPARQACASTGALSISPDAASCRGVKGDSTAAEDPLVSYLSQNYFIQEDYYFSPLQLLAAAMHHWILLRAREMCSQDWVCLLSAFSHVQRVKAAFSLFVVRHLRRLTTPASDHRSSLKNSSWGASLSRKSSLSAASCEAYTSSIASGPAGRLKGCALPKGTVAASMATTQVERGLSCPGSSVCDTSFVVEPHNAFSLLHEPSCVRSRKSTTFSATEVALAENPHFQVLDSESASQDAVAISNTAAAVSAAQSAIAAAAAASSERRMLVLSPFSDLATAVPSCLHAGSPTSQLVFNLYQSCSGLGVRPLMSRNNRGGCHDRVLGLNSSTGAMPAISPSHMNVASGRAITPVPPPPSSAGVRSTPTVDSCRDSACMRQGEEPSTLMTHTDESCQPSTPVTSPSPPPSVAAFLRALQHILLLLQQHLETSAVLTSLTAVTLAVVELHCASIEKVRVLEEHAALWRGPQGGAGGRLDPGLLSFTQKNEVCLKEHGNFTKNVAEKGCMKVPHVSSTFRGGVLHDLQQGAQQIRFNSSGERAINPIFEIFVPVYDLLCQKSDIQRLLPGLAAARENRFTHTVMFLSALVKALRLADEEKNLLRGKACARGRPEARGSVRETQHRPSPLHSAAASPPRDSVSCTNVQIPEPVDLSQRLRKRVSRLFRCALLEPSQMRVSRCSSPITADHSLSRPPGHATLISDPDTDVPQYYLDESNLSPQGKIGPTTQLSKTLPSSVFDALLAWSPTARDLTELVTAACFLISPSSAYESYEIGGDGTTEKSTADISALSSVGQVSDAGALSIPDPLGLSPGQGGCSAVPGDIYGSETRTANGDERCLLWSFLRACCNYVVNVLKKYDEEPPASTSVTEAFQLAQSHAGSVRKTRLLPRDVSSLAECFYRCGLFSDVEFEAFGQYIMASGRRLYHAVASATVFTGYDFVCLLQLLVRPELSELPGLERSEREHRLPHEEHSAQHSAWQSPLAARLAAFMLDGMLPMCITSFDDKSLARLAVWLGNYFKKLQVYDRCNRLGTWTRHPLSRGRPRGYSALPCDGSLPREAWVPTQRVTSLSANEGLRLQLPAMRGLLERATYCFVQELLLRVCGVEGTSRFPSLNDPAQTLGEFFVTKTAQDGHLVPRVYLPPLVPVRMSVAAAKTSRSHPLSCALRSAKADRHFESPQSYTSVLLGLSRLPRDLLLLPNRRSEFFKPQVGFESRDVRIFDSSELVSISASQSTSYDVPLEARVPAGVLLLRTLLSKHYLKQLFARSATIKQWELNVFFSALQHLPLVFPGGPWRTEEFAEVNSERHVYAKYGLFVTGQTLCMQKCATLREKVLRTVFQETLFDS